MPRAHATAGAGRKNDQMRVSARALQTRTTHRGREVPSFREYTYDFGTDYAFAEAQEAGVTPNYEAQFSSEPMAVTVQ